MQYDFSTYINRRDSYSLKWHVSENELPMWVADMDFKIAPEIHSGLQEVLQHGIFGYSVIPEEYYTSIIDWWKKRYNFCMQKEWILYATGVVPAIGAILRTKSDIGDKILIQSPVYHVFYRCIEENNRQVIVNELCFENGVYSINFDDLEQKLSDPKTKIMILCNPHNPIGKIWEKEVLQKIGHLCAKYNVLVIADEIHCDVTYNERYTPFASIDTICAQNSISTFSPSKTFNIADLHTAFVVIANKELHDEIERVYKIEYVNNPNVFGIKASILAYSMGEMWLESLLKYLANNRAIAQDFFTTHLQELFLIPSNATYLLWVDCSKIIDNADIFCSTLRKDTGLYLSSGLAFGKNAKTFFRMNIACPESSLHDGLARLHKGISIKYRE
ncbi:hypothetical protein CQA53_01680 [Helicobacter didelphidarum]|uniref:cysteine-S-conjugate beta-lyase n=1 Tax=Helicobacter didelphidarum TaxID=2040648 RepID=A0A3D8IPT5_9HELI|nr:MalY/PatB family protein [Helicobacter didelphidarum]RDU67000.1 hypothetical protein CQA53_01680 [Helicobacter didelphidarum]